MATGKRYYWLKLKESFMTSDTIDYFMSQQDGANYVVLYQMLCLKTINTDGRLSRQIGEVIIPYDVEKIRRDCKWFSADTIRVALKLYQSFGLIYVDADGTLVLADHDNLVGSETDYAEKNRRMRTNQKNQLPPAGNSTGHIVSDDVSANVTTDIRDRDKENRDKSSDRDSRGKNEKADAFSAFAGDDDELLRTLRDFELMRTKIKKPMTDRAKQLLVSKLEKYPIEQQIPVLEQSIVHCWQDIYDLKDDTRQRETGRSSMDDLRSLHDMYAAEEDL